MPINLDYLRRPTLREVARFFDPEYSRAWVRGLDAETRRTWDLESIPFARMGSGDAEQAGVAGPLVLQHGRDRIDLNRLGRGSYQLPFAVEPAEWKLRSRGARGVLVVDEGYYLRELCRARYPTKSRLVLVYTDGLIRAQVRGLLRRLANELDLPIYMLTDNHPLKYFHYSVLRRGAVLPHLTCRKTALDEVRFLGLRAGEPITRTPRIPNPFVFKAGREVPSMLRCLRRYRCFRARPWQEEFDRFEEQRGWIEAFALLAIRKVAGFAEYIETRISNRDWLS